MLFILANYADEKHSCYPSEKHLAKIVGVSDRSVRRCLKNLAHNNQVLIQHRLGTSNRYFLNINSVDIGDHTPVDTRVQRVRNSVSINTKDIQKNKMGKTKRNLNELAG